MTRHLYMYENCMNIRINIQKYEKKEKKREWHNRNISKIYKLCLEDRKISNIKIKNSHLLQMPYIGINTSYNCH